MNAKDDAYVPMSVGFVHPSFTTYLFPQALRYTDMQPSFRVYEADAETFTLLDYTQYRLYIEIANKQSFPEWQVAYRFKSYYNAKDMTPWSFALIVQQMRVGRRL